MFKFSLKKNLVKLFLLSSICLSITFSNPQKSFAVESDSNIKYHSTGNLILIADNSSSLLRMAEKVKKFIDENKNDVGRFLKGCFHPTTTYIDDSLEILDVNESGVVVQFNYQGWIRFHQMKVILLWDGSHGSTTILSDTGAISGTPIGHVNYCDGLKSMFESVK